jgi:hypothetical protein
MVGRADSEYFILALVELLIRKKAALADQWFGQVVATYPDESSRFLKRKQDQFHNPVGHTLAEHTEALLDQLIGPMDQEKITASLDRIVRIRAIQDFSASQALAFIPTLKGIVRRQFSKELAKGDMAEELRQLEERLDQVLLMAFDVFMSVRQRVYEIKCEEVKRLYYQVIRRADIVVPLPQQEEPDLTPVK